VGAIVRLTSLCLSLFTLHAAATTYYVDINNPAPTPPYTSWATAATNIQDAVDAAGSGDTVLVTNGIYQTGGRPMVTPDFGPILTNRVVLTNSILLRSVNGPGVTLIVGNQVPGTITDYGAVRCLYLDNGAVVNGFTITNGATGPAGSDGIWESWAGGVNCPSGNGVATNCIIINNVSGDNGGGVNGGTYYNCQFLGNSSSYGGGAESAILNHCTFAGNSAFAAGQGSGGGAIYSTLTNCFLTNNSSDYAGGAGYSTLNDCSLDGNFSDGNGGGAGASTLYECTLTANSCTNSGGAADTSHLYNCLVTQNSAAVDGGGVENCYDINCTIANNSAGQAGGGADASELDNCINYFNAASSNANYTVGTCIFNYSCTTPLAPGTNNVVSDPLFVNLASGDLHLQTNSPCINAGNNSYLTNNDDAISLTNDLDGNPRVTGVTVDAGAYEFFIPAAITADNTNVSIGFPVNFTWQFVAGNISELVIDFGDGVLLTNPPVANHSWSVPGDYSVTITAFTDLDPGGISADVVVHVVAGNYYVSSTSANPQPPYSSWTTAANNIQDAVNAAFVGGTIWVSNGVYADGMSSADGATTNRVTVIGPFTLRSVNGAAQTTIDGGGIMRCVYLGNGAVLDGFTLQNGSTFDIGGGVDGDSTNILVSDCRLTANSAEMGGGAESCTLNRCTFTDNVATNEGGGADGSTLNNCIISANIADGNGGGANNCVLNNCALTGNSVSQFGGALENCLANNCTLTANSANWWSGGASDSTLNNCIAYFNLAPSEANFAGSTLNYSCTTPLPDSGTNDIVTDPLLADAYHLSANSPCIGAGSASFSSGVDIDGEPWLAPPSIGCDEYDAGSVTGALSVAISADYLEAPTNFALNFTGVISGHASNNVWDFGDGTTLNDEVFAVQHAWATPGDYPVTLTVFNNDNPGGISATTIVHIATQVVYYVDPNSINPIAPYNSWSTAATNIQDAIGVAVPAANSLVLVTNGIYQIGSQVSGDSVSNRVILTKPIILQSVNGPAVTSIDGAAAMRCVYVSAGGQLNGFTLTNGWSSGNGGGVDCESGATVSNCVVIKNFAAAPGGGACGGTLLNCALFANSVSGSGGGASSAILNNCAFDNNSASANGGGADSCTLNNCTIANNSAQVDGGGANNCTLNNCIDYYNTATVEPGQPNYFSSSLNYCCSLPLAGGPGNIANAPLLIDYAHVASNSPCIGAGSASYSSGTDIDGEPWLNPPSIGCDEFYAGSFTGPLVAQIQADFTNVIPGFTSTFLGMILGHANTTQWTFDDGTVASNQFLVSHAWQSPGNHFVILTAMNADNPGGISATVAVQVVSQSIGYVSQNNPNPVPPYASWTTAATNIQDAVDAAGAGATVLVSNGVYQTGVRIVTGGEFNRVAVTKPLTLASINGPLVTSILGGPSDYWADGTRCVYLAKGATLSGFTLTQGTTISGPEFFVFALSVQESYGGGVYCEDNSSVISNCVVTGNIAGNGAGGVYQGTVNNSILSDNTGTYFWSDFVSFDRDYGGSGGGGAGNSILNNCLISGNLGGWIAGGVVNSTLNNCTVAGNTAANSGGGVDNCTLTNCIVIDNGLQFWNPPALDSANSSLSYCFTDSSTPGIGNISGDPAFVDSANGNFRLQTNSICINAGDNSAVLGNVDLDGRPRVVGGTVDLGAYEFQKPGLGEYLGWLQQYGLPTDGSVDSADLDGTGFTVNQDWIAGLNPTNPASILAMLTPVTTNAATGVTITWQSVSGIPYFLQRSTNVQSEPAFITIQSNITGQTNTTSYTDITATNNVPYFYRVGVVAP
jgi:hypothetical protein